MRWKAATSPGDGANAAARRLRRNVAANVVGESLWGFQTALVLSATVLVVLLKKLGAGPALIGSIAAIEAASVLSQLPGSYLFRSRQKRRWRLIGFQLSLMVPSLLLMGVLAMFGGNLAPAAVRWGLLGGWALFMLSGGACGAAWFDWLAHLFAREVRGTVMGVTFCASSAAGALAALLASRMLGAAPLLSDYGVLYLIAGGLAALSILTFVTVDDPAEGEADARQVTVRALVRDFHDSVRDANFRSYLVGRALAAAGFCVLPLITAYYAGSAGGSVPAATIVAAGSALAVASAAGNLLLGRIGDRHGHRYGIIFGALMQVVALAVVLLVPGALGCVIACAAAGLCQSAGFLAHTNLLIETCRHENRLAHMTVGNLLLAPVTIGAPLIAAQAAAFAGSRPVFVVCLAVSVAAAAWLILRLREPRSLPAPAAVPGAKETAGKMHAA